MKLRPKGAPSLNLPKGTVVKGNLLMEERKVVNILAIL
jgi:hypothetical protein